MTDTIIRSQSDEYHALSDEQRALYAEARDCGADHEDAIDAALSFGGYR